MKKILLSLILFAAIVFDAAAQQYPAIWVNAGPDQVLPCGANCTTLIASHLPSFTSATGTLYVDSAITYAPFSYLGGTLPTPSFFTFDDSYSATANSLPFYFCFFGNPYDQLVLGNNGVISFDLANIGGSNAWPLQGQGTIPSASGSFATDLNIIMGPYMDIYPPALAPQNADYINFGVYGTAPNRRFVISYFDVPFYLLGANCNDSITCQTVLYETTNVIDIFIGHKPICAAWNGGLAVEGIQNATGTIAYTAPGRNNTQWAATNDGYRFIPAGNINLVTVKWYQGDSVYIGSGDTVNVCPPNNQSTMYVARAYFADCYDTAQVRDTMYVNVLQSAGPPQYISCPSPTTALNMNATGTGTWVAIPTNPSATTIANPISPTTLITGFSAVGTYKFQWSSGLCVDTASVIVSLSPNAGPDQNRCKNDTVGMAAIGTGTWTALPTNPSPTVIAAPTQNNTNITGFTAGGAYSFVWTTNPGCSDTMVVNIPFFSLTMSAGSTTVCQYSNTTVTVTPSPANLSPFQYTWLDSSIVQSPHSATTAINGLPGNTYFHVQVTSNDGCKLEDSILITTTTNVGTVIKASANPSVVCSGNATQLTVVGNPNSCGLATGACNGSNTIVSAGTATTFQTGAGDQYPSPYGNYFASAHHQFLIHASELLAQIPSGGQIKSVAFDIHTLNGGSSLSNFTIKMACVSVDSLDQAFAGIGSLTQVYTTASYTPIANWNIHTLTTPYDWDGVSNLIVDVCFDNAGGGNINPKMEYTQTQFQSVWCTYSNDAGGECNVVGYQEHIVVPYPQLFDRPNMQFNMCLTNLNGANLQWTPNTGPDAPTPTNLDTVIAHPTATTQYEVELISANGCINYDFVTVLVDTTSKLSFNNDTFVCTPQPIRLNALVTGDSVVPAQVVYTWTASTGAAPPSGTGPTFASATVTPTVSTTYTVSVTGGLSCPLFDSMHVTVGTGLPLTSVVDSVKCTGNNNGKIIVTPAGGTAPYTYTWSPNLSTVDSIMNLSPGTYHLTVNDAGGCVGHDSFTLAAPVPMALTFDSSNMQCFNSNIDTIKALVTGGRSPYRYTWNPPAANSSTLTDLAIGNYTLTVTDTSGCTVSGSVNITQPAQLVSSLISTNLSGANSNNGTITVTTTGGVMPYTYACDSPITGLPNATNLDTGVYIITICDANHCCVKDTAHISGPPPIAITFSVTNDQCPGQCIGTATLTAAGGVLPYTYQWTDLTTGTTLGTNTTISGLCAGTYQVVVTDANGITVSKDTVISAPAPIGEKIDSTPIACFGQTNGILFDSIYGGTSPYTVTWNSGTGNPLTNLGPGIYIANVTDANGCPAADTAYLGEPTPITASIISTDSVTCFGGTNGYANVQASGGRLPYTYTWTGSNSVDSFANNLTAGTQSVTVKDAAGCTFTVPSFTIYQPSQLVISGVDTIAAHCSISNDGHATAVVSGGSPAYTYVWDGTSTGNVDSVTGLVTGNHTLSVTDSKGCSTSASFFINIQYTLAVTLASDSVTCNGGNNGVAFVSQINGSPIYTYQWNPSSSTTDSATGLSASTQSLTVTDMYGCTATGSVVVGQPNNPEYEYDYQAPLCTGEHNGKFWFDFVNLVLPGQAGPLTYTFNGVAYAVTDTVYNIPAGTDSVILTYNDHGCTTGFTLTLTDPKQLSVSPPAVTGISCANDANGVITVAASGGTRPYSYAWSPGGYTDSTESNLGPANYIITVTDANGCTASTSDSLTAPPLIADSLIIDSTSCPGSADGHIIVNAWGGTPGNPITYTYSIDGTNYQQENNFFSLAAGTYTIYVKDSPGCILQSTATVYQPSAITLWINPQDSLIALGASIQLYSVIGNLTTQSINSYAWTPAVGLSCLDCPNPVASPFQTTAYYLTVNYGKGCNVTDSNLIEIGKGASVYIPNAFTPNGDGIDDIFEVFGTTLQSVGMKVFDRWGEKVFDSQGSQWATWDGTYRGVMQPPGVYIYYVTLVFLDGTSQVREGSITLIR